MPRILLVDDDVRISAMLKEFLDIEGMTAVTAEDAQMAAAQLEGGVDLMLLDINMPGTDGLTLLKRLRTHSNIPVILLTANVSQADKVLGLGIGADDYITKPFDPLEVIARIKALLRRTGTPGRAEAPERYGSLTLHRDSREVFVDERPVHLSYTEYQLLLCLIDHRNQVVTREDLLRNVWHSGIYHLNTVNTNIMRLREKLSAPEGTAGWIHTVRGHGYIFKPH